jgi:membrane-associated phospholipid phosphatase
MAAGASDSPGVPTLRNPRLAALAWLSVYLAATSIVLAGSGHGRLAAAHGAVIAIACWAVVRRTAVAGVTGDLLPLIVAPLLYGEIPLLITALGVSYHDTLIAGWDFRLFGNQPSRTLASAIPITLVSELLHAGYLAYYPVIFGPPLLLLVRGRRRALHHTVLALTITYTLCWTIFALFPVEGPRFLWTAPSGMPDGPFRRLAAHILAVGSSRGAAFPSSHMAVSVVQALMAWRWQRGLAPALSVIAVLVGVGAVYGGFHYASDMLAGAMLAVVVAAALWNRSE